MKPVVAAISLAIPSAAPTLPALPAVSPAVVAPYHPLPAIRVELPPDFPPVQFAVGPENRVPAHYRPLFLSSLASKADELRAWIDRAATNSDGAALTLTLGRFYENAAAWGVEGTLTTASRRLAGFDLAVWKDGSGLTRIKTKP